MYPTINGTALNCCGNRGKSKINGRCTDKGHTREEVKKCKAGIKNKRKKREVAIIALKMKKL